MQNITRREQISFGFIAILTIVVLTLGISRMSPDVPPLEPKTGAGESFVVAAKGDTATPKSELLSATEEPPTVAQQSDGNSTKLVEGADDKTIEGQTVEPTKLVVHVSGAVRRAGVYTLKPGDRIEDAVRLAGGFKKNAATDALNRADRIQDGDHIVIPTRTELVKAIEGSAPTVPPRLSATAQSRVAAAARPVSQNLAVVLPASSSSVAAVLSAVRNKPRKRGRVVGLVSNVGILRSGNVVRLSPQNGTGPAATNAETDTNASDEESRDAPAAVSEKFKSPGDGTVSLNTATGDEFQKLPGIGPAMGERILQHRKEIGKFETLEQLKDVRGIGDKKFAKMLPFLRLN